jgi:hypothetical protein
LRGWLCAAALVVLPPPGALAAGPSSCESCHSDASRVGAETLRVVKSHGDDVHAELGFSCHDCHGGNPDPELADDPAAAMDASFESNPYRGAPQRRDVPGFCGRCHSEPAVMRRFDPRARVDQEREYWTSRHGLALERGDTRVATCIDCHGSHSVLRIDDLASPVFPTHVAETCAGCHANSDTMEGYLTDDGRPLPVDQYALWSESVHASALLEREDLSAPTCNDCHGNHGAVPPDVQSVAQICGQCHNREAQLFLESPKSEGFRRHNELIGAVGEEGCATCHAEPEPQSQLTDVHTLGECTACHRNHAVIRPTVAMLSPLPEAPCSFCHEAPGPRYQALLGSEVAAENYRAVRDQLLAGAESDGLQGSARFDWLVEQARLLPFHTLAAPGGGEAARLRPEFERLFRKFRIGKTRFTYRDSSSGEPVEETVVRCSTCHAAEPLLADAPRGLEMAAELLERMRELTALTASAERTMLRARRGGVQTSHVLIEIDQSVDAQVELEVLVHGFAVGPESEFARKHADGMEHASAALTLAREALDELASRRRGLIRFLVVIGIVLLSLGLKIRQVARRREHEAAASGA